MDTQAATPSDGPWATAGSNPLPLVLIVEDSPTSSMMLRMRVGAGGYPVVTAADGREALEVIEAAKPKIIVSDWQMPDVSGPELCRELRAREERGEANYVYFIMHTGRSDKADIAAGLMAGADDFLIKPASEGELLARLYAGRRVVELSERLMAQNRHLNAANVRMEKMFADMERDLQIAGQLQSSLLPPAHAVLPGVEVSVIYHPAGYVGGDLIGYFAFGETGFGAYAVDVAGHGVAAALLTFELHQLFDGPRGDGRFFLKSRDARGPALDVARSPAEVAAELNKRFLRSDRGDLYFTMALAVVDLATGQAKLCQAGSEPPLHLRATGTIEALGTGGPPIGLLPDMSYTEVDFSLPPGDRLMLYTDGLADAEKWNGEHITAEGLRALLRDHADLAADAVLDTLYERLKEETGCAWWDDDASAALVTRR